MASEVEAAIADHRAAASRPTSLPEQDYPLTQAAHADYGRAGAALSSLEI
jgi:hypothetical protein